MAPRALAPPVDYTDPDAPRSYHRPKGRPRWADDPEKVNAVLQDFEDNGVDPKERARERAHVAAHKEQARRDRAAKARAARERSTAHTAALAEDKRRGAAAAKAAADAAEAASVRGRAKRVGQVADTVGSVTGGGGLRIDDASGFVLGLLAWSWVILPMLNNGPSGVRDMLRAKFVNKDQNGNPLP